MELLAIVGSIRKESYNMRLAFTIRERYKEQFNLQIADIESLPFYNQDEENNPPEPVLRLKRMIREADGILFITPEYNWSIPGVMKNAIDWASRVEKVFINKPVMTLGVSLSKVGTLRAQIHLRQILSAPGLQTKLLPPGSNEIIIPEANKKFDEPNGPLSDQSTLDVIDKRIVAFLNFIKEI